MLGVGACVLAAAAPATAQQLNAPAPKPEAAAAQSAGGIPAQPLRLTLQDAIERARRYSVDFQAAQTSAALAREDHVQARDALLPNVSYNNGVLYTQGDGSGNPRFIANNGVHEYISQGTVHETLDLAALAAYRRSAAAAAVAKAKAEITSRGLVVTVVKNYFALAAAQLKNENAQKAREEGQRFLKITQDLENGGEVAHSDVIKAELQARERKRQAQEAELILLNARLDLAVLLFPNYNEQFDLADDLHSPASLPPLAEAQQRAAQDNPELRAALAGVSEANHGVLENRAAYFPSLTLDYFYGIDATHFATYTNGLSNLGSSASATLNIPVWNWGATQSKVRQAQLRRTQAQRELSFTQRRLLAETKSLYAEAETALDELSSLSRSAELAAESLRLITLRYRDGESTVLEVVDAQNTAVLASAAYQDGAVRYRVALANLQTLTGVLTTP